MSPNKKLVDIYERGYRVTEEGTLLGPDKEPFPVWVDDDGYIRFTARCSNGARSNFGVHRLVAYQKYGEKLFEAKIEVRHLNGPGDNSWKHIAIGTHSQNMMDVDKKVRVKNGRKARRKYDDSVYPQIRRDREAGASYPELVEKYRLAKSTIWSIINNETNVA